MKYRINIRYQTGNSFGSSDEEDYLELEWDNLDVAKENLQFIKEHYAQYEYLDSSEFHRNNMTKQEVFVQNSDKDWFVGILRPIDKHGAITTQEEADKRGYTNVTFDGYHAENCIKLKADNGDFMQIGAYWTGYFESLHGANIVCSEDDDMGFDVD